MEDHNRFFVFFEPLQTLQLESFGGVKPTRYPGGGTHVVRGFIQIKTSGVYELRPGYGGSTHNIMEVNGSEVYRKEPGQDAVHRHTELTAGQKVPFKITYLTEQADGLGWIARVDIPGTLATVVNHLKPRGNVLISSELPLGDEFADVLYRGDPAALHQVLAHCAICIGESATLASEASVLGVPSIYAAEVGRGYTDEQETLYGLVTNLRELDGDQIISAIDKILGHGKEHWQGQRARLLDECVDVTGLIMELATQYGNR